MLHRPDMYIGTVKNVKCEFYGASLVTVKPSPSPSEIACSAEEVGDSKDETEIVIERIEDEINHGLHRIFVEILSYMSEKC